MKISLHPLRVFGRKKQESTCYPVGTAFLNYIEEDQKNRKLNMIVQIKDRVDRSTVVQSFLVKIPIEGLQRFCKAAGFSLTNVPNQKNKDCKWRVVQYSIRPSRKQQ